MITTLQDPRLNFWEPCNGYNGRYDMDVQYSYTPPSEYGSSYVYQQQWSGGCYTASPYDNGYYNPYYYNEDRRCSCYCPLKPGAASAGRFCENCLPRPPCPGNYGPDGKINPNMTQPACQLTSVTVSRVDSFVSTWDALLPSGTSALSSFRKTGAAFNTPPLTFPAQTPPSSAGFVPLFQTSCSGEFAFSLGTPSLGLAISMPRIMEVSSFIMQTMHFVEGCRLRAVDPAASPLTQAQFLLRYGAHQVRTACVQSQALHAAHAAAALRCLGRR